MVSMACRSPRGPQVRLEGNGRGSHQQDRIQVRPSGRVKPRQEVEQRDDPRLIKERHVRGDVAT